MGARRFVGGISRDALRTAFRDWFGLQENQADLLVVLFEQRGRPLPSMKISRCIQSHRPLTVAAIHERVRVIRQTMEAESIDSDEAGYRLTEIGMGECRLALREMARTFLGHGYELAGVPGRYEFEVGAERAAEEGVGEETMVA